MTTQTQKGKPMSGKPDTSMMPMEAGLSDDDIRTLIWRELDEEYRVMQGEECLSWPSLIDVFSSEGYCIARISVDGEEGTYKLAFQIDTAGDLEFTGDPVPVKRGDWVETTAKMVAAAVVVDDESAAAQMMADLRENNPLIAALIGTPNFHPIIFDLTTIGRPSQHLGAMKYQLSPKKLDAALLTLIAKPVHVTKKFDAHVDAGMAPVAVGSFLGAMPVANPDGTLTVRAIATLWSEDFPELVKDIEAKRLLLGSSYELSYVAATANRISPNVLEIEDYVFSGAALLFKGSAAHPETQILLASQVEEHTFDVFDEDDLAPLLAWLRGATTMLQAKTLTYKERGALKDSDFALIQADGDRKIRRFPIQDEAHRKNAWARLSQAKNLSDAERTQVANKIMSRAKSSGDAWAKDYKKSGGQWTKTTKGGSSMSTKYTGIPEELQATVDQLIATAIAEFQKAHGGKPLAANAGEPDVDLADAAKVKAYVLALTARAATAETRNVELENKVKELEAAKLKVETDLTAAKTELETAQAEIVKRDVAAELEKVWATLKATYGLTDDHRKGREPLLTKLAEKKEPLTLAEYQQLIAGGTVGTVPLRAGAGDPGAREPIDKEAVARAFPAVKPRLR